MKAPKARLSRAKAPLRMTKRAPDILAACSKSIRPRASPSWKCSLASKSNWRGVPCLRSSTLAASSAPSGTSSAGRLGIPAKASSRAAFNRWAAASISAWASLSLAPRAMTSAASSPLAFRAPISLEMALRRVWISWAAVSFPRLWVSSAISSLARGSNPRRLRPPSKASGFSRIQRMSNTGRHLFRGPEAISARPPTVHRV